MDISLKWNVVLYSWNWEVKCQCFRFVFLIFKIVTFDLKYWNFKQGNWTSF